MPLENANVVRTINGGPVRNTVTRWSEHNNPDHLSEPAKYVGRDVDHEITREILSSVPKNEVIG